MKSILSKVKGITLIALVITMVVLIILAGIIISLCIGNNGILSRARVARDEYTNEQDYEQEQVNVIGAQITNMVNGSGSTTPTENTEKLSASNYEKVKTKYLGSELIEVDYTPETTNATVLVDGANNGGLADQTFTQSDTGATGNNKVKWYVLEANENEVKLVSSVSKKQVQFKDSSGYDNCLYYLNDITTTLFRNDSLGVTQDKVHAFRLTDIKEAAESLNGSSYNWDTTFVNGATSKSKGVTKIGDSKTYTNISCTYYPKIYTAIGTTVIANNPMYDETLGSKITDDSGMKRKETGNPASSLTVNGTYFGYSNRDTMTRKMSTFGNNGLAEELFNSNGTKYLLATRYIYASSDEAYYEIFHISSGGSLPHTGCCYSSGTLYQKGGAFRVVVSVPASHVNVANDGSITLE